MNIDHILVGPPGVCVIDSKNWKSAPLSIDNRGIALGRYRKDNELGSVAAAAAAVHASAATTLPGVITAPVLAFVAHMGLPEPVFRHGVVMLQAEQLLPWLTQQPRVLTPQQVNQVASALGAAFLPRAGGSKPLTIATLDRYRAPAQPTPAALASPAARSLAASGRSGRARGSSDRPPRRQGRFPVTMRTPYKKRDVSGSLLHDAMSWLLRATATVVLFVLLLTLGVPLGTKFFQYTLQKLVDGVVSSAVTTPSPSQSILPLRKTLRPVPQRSR